MPRCHIATLVVDVVGGCALSLVLLACSGPDIEAAEPTSEADTSEVALAVGGQRLLSARDAQSYLLVEGGDAVRVKVSPDAVQFVVVGLHEGRVLLRVDRRFDSESFRIVVRRDAPRIPLGVFDETHQIVLSIGERFQMPATGMRAYSEGPGNVVANTITEDGRTMFLEGRSPGHTSLLLFMEPRRTVYYDIEVTSDSAR